MTCMDVQNLITPFIKNQLDMKTLEQFLGHVINCPTCMEELDVYFALLTAMEQLDNDKELSKNYSFELKNKLKHAEDSIRRNKAKQIRHRFYLLFVLVSFVLITSISFGKSQVEPVSNKIPSFQFYYSGVPTRVSPVSNLFLEYGTSLYKYQKHRMIGRMAMYEAEREYWYFTFFSD